MALAQGLSRGYSQQAASSEGWAGAGGAVHDDALAGLLVGGLSVALASLECDPRDCWWKVLV